MEDESFFSCSITKFAIYSAILKARYINLMYNLDDNLKIYK